MAAPTSFTITVATTGAPAAYTGGGTRLVWTITAPWGIYYSTQGVTEGLYAVCEKAGSDWGGRMQAYLTNSANTNNTEVGTP